jgi:hypothetical protein
MWKSIKKTGGRRDESANKKVKKGLNRIKKNGG